MLKILSILVTLLLIVLFPPAVLAYVSNNAVPGDWSYPIKRKLEDGILFAASFNPTTKAKFTVTRYNRRFEESKSLIKDRKKGSTKTLKELLNQTKQAGDAIGNVTDPNEKQKLSHQYEQTIKEYKSQLNKYVQDLSDESGKGTPDPTPPPIPSPEPNPSDYVAPNPSPSTSIFLNPVPTPIAQVTPTPAARVTPTPAVNVTPTPGTASPRPSPSQAPQNPSPPPGGGVNPNDPCDHLETEPPTSEYIKCISDNLPEKLDTGAAPKAYGASNLNTEGSPNRPGGLGIAGGPNSENNVNTNLLNTIKLDLSQLNPDVLNVIIAIPLSSPPNLIDCKNSRNKIIVNKDAASTRLNNAQTQLNNSLSKISEIFTTQIENKFGGSKKLERQYGAVITAASEEKLNSQNNIQTLNQLMNDFTCGSAPNYGVQISNFNSAINLQITLFKSYRDKLNQMILILLEIADNPRN